MYSGLSVGLARRWGSRHTTTSASKMRCLLRNCWKSACAFCKRKCILRNGSFGKKANSAFMEGETVWLTQAQIADLFGTKRPVITKHLKNIYASQELDESSTCSILEHMGNDSKQVYETKYYNLDAILSVGYRVNSKNATLFRRWASQVLKDYMLKGYAVNQRKIATDFTCANFAHVGVDADQTYKLPMKGR